MQRLLLTGAFLFASASVFAQTPYAQGCRRLPSRLPGTPALDDVTLHNLAAFYFF